MGSDVRGGRQKQAAKYAEGAEYLSPADQRAFIRDVATSLDERMRAIVQGAAGPEAVRTFPSGATRSATHDKLDYEGFLSPLVLERYARYMHAHRIQADGTVLASDNWQRGIPTGEYLKSAFRHFMEWWTAYRVGPLSTPELQDSLCALLFNVMGALHVELQTERSLKAADAARQ